MSPTLLRLALAYKLRRDVSYPDWCLSYGYKIRHGYHMRVRLHSTARARSYASNTVVR